MQIQLSFKRIFLGPGKTFAVPTAPGARVRVVDGMVWATTSSSPDDIWLGAGDEHTVERSGLTVVESVARSTVELIPPPTTRTRGHSINGYEIATFPRGLQYVAAVAMTAITIGLLVVLPAKVDSGSWEVRPPVASNTMATTPTAVVSPPGGIVKPQG